MAFNLSLKIFPEPLRSVSATSISGSPGTYISFKTGSGVAGLLNPVRIVEFVNATDQPVLISWDGVTDHMIVPSNGFVLLDISTNKAEVGGAFNIAQGQVFYAKALSSQPATGSVYLMAFYGVSV